MRAFAYARAALDAIIIYNRLFFLDLYRGNRANLDTFPTTGAILFIYFCCHIILCFLSAYWLFSVPLNRFYNSYIQGNIYSPGPFHLYTTSFRRSNRPGTSHNNVIYLGAYITSLYLYLYGLPF